MRSKKRQRVKVHGHLAVIAACVIDVRRKLPVHRTAQLFGVSRATIWNWERKGVDYGEVSRAQKQRCIEAALVCERLVKLQRELRYT